MLWFCGPRHAVWVVIGRRLWTVSLTFPRCDLSSLLIVASALKLISLRSSSVLISYRTSWEGCTCGLFFIIRQVRSQRSFLICLCTWAILEHCMWSVAWRHKGGLRSLPWTRPLGSTRNLWWVKYRVISEKRCVTQRTATCVVYFPLPRFRIYPVTQRSFAWRDKTGRESSSENQGQSFGPGEK